MTAPKPLYQVLAILFVAEENCAQSGNNEWRVRHRDRLLELVRKHMPSGSGIDSGTEIDAARTTGNKLVFNTSFHHMDENGTYDGWTEHTVTITPSLMCGIELKITGRNRNDIKDYLHDIFHAALTTEIAE